MKNIKNILVSCFVTALSLGAFAADNENIVSQDEDYIIYQMTESDSLKDLAEKHLGGAEYILELMKYNEIENINSVSEGSTIVIPQRIRTHAINTLKEAEEKLTLALNASSDQFATARYNEALGILENARSARGQANYDQAIALAKLAIENSRMAKEEADINAWIQQTASILTLHGDVKISNDNAKSWEAAKPGDKLNVGQLIKTSGNSTAQLKLADESIIQLKADTIVGVEDQLIDQRDKQRRSKLQVMLGDILGNITPKKNKNSKFEINTQGASIAIRGTELLVSAPTKELTNVSVLHGLTEVKSSVSAGDLPGGYGSQVAKDKPVSSPIKLLEAPRILSPEAAHLKTAKQNIGFKWKKVSKAGSYLFEIADDKGFNYMVESKKVNTTELSSSTLREGIYYWRITTIDKKGIIGIGSAINKITLKKNIDLNLKELKDITKHEGKNYGGVKHAIALVPNSSSTSLISLEYSVNNGATRKYVEPIHFHQDGLYTIKYRGLTADGGYSPYQSYTMIADTHAPEISTKAVVTSEDKYINGNLSAFHTARVSFTAQDVAGTDKLEYRIDGGPFQTYKGPFQLPLYKDVNLNYRAVDVLGNSTPIIQKVLKAVSADL